MPPRSLASRALAQLAEHLWLVSPDDIDVDAAGSAGFGLSLCGSPTSPDVEVRERYLAIPDLTNPSYLLPFEDDWRPAVRMLKAYNNLREPRRRLRRSLVSGALRSGALRQDARRLDVVQKTGVPPFESILDHIGAQLGRPGTSLIVGCGVKPLDGHAKPTLVVADRSGRLLAFVKLTMLPQIRTRLLCESEAMTQLSDGSSPVHVPRPLFLTEWRGRTLLGLTPLPEDVRPVTFRHESRVLRELDRLVAHRGVRSYRLGDSPWIAELRSRAARLHPNACAPMLAELEHFVRRHGSVRLDHGVRHGDWSPWNLAWLRTGQLAVWDWEYYEEVAPVGLDHLNWRYIREHVTRGRSAVKAAEQLPAFARAVLGSRLREELVSVLTSLFILDMAIRTATVAADSDEAAMGEALSLVATLGSAPT